MRHLVTAIRVLAGLALLTPLVVGGASFIYPFVVPKVLLVRAATELMVGLYVLLAAARWDRFGIRPTPITVLLGAYLASFAVSTFAGVDPYRSLWDTHERMLGLFTIAHYVAYYAVLTTVARGWGVWRWLFWVALAAGSAVALVGVYQRFIDPQALFNQGGTRVSATLGHPSYLGGLGAFTFFCGALLAAREGGAGRRRWAIGLGGLGAALGIVAAIISETRGTQIGLGVGAVVTCGAYLAVLDRRSWQWWALGCAFALCLAAGATLYAVKDWEGLRRVPFFSRYYGMSIGTGTGRTRVLAWGMALEGARERPVVGWGPNNYYYVHSRYYRPELLRFGEIETWFDNAHNVVLNTLVVQGVPGLLSYAALLGAPFVLLWRGYRRGAADPHVCCVATGWLATHLVHNIFVFENASSWLAFVFLLAFLNAETGSGRGDPEAGGRAPGGATGIIPFRAGVAALAVVGTGLLVGFGVVVVARANMLGLESLRHVHAGRLDEALAAFERSEALSSPHRDGVRGMFAEAVLARVNQVARLRGGIEMQDRRDALVAHEAIGAAQGSGSEAGAREAARLRAAEERRRAYVGRILAARAREEANLRALAIRAFDELGENLRLHLRDVRLPLARAKLAQGIVVYLGGDPRRLAAVDDELVAALELSPRRQQLAITLAEVREARSRYEGARERELRGQAEALLRQAIEWDPVVDEGWWRLAIFWSDRGEPERARAVLAEAEVRGVVWRANALPIVAAIRASE